MLLSPFVMEQVFRGKQTGFRAGPERGAWIEKPLGVMRLQNHCLPAEGMIASRVKRLID
jgi:hypothetical protein